MLAASSDPFFLRYAFLAPAMMALSFVLILFFGKRLPKKGSEIGIALVGLSFLFSLAAAVQWMQRTDAGHEGVEPVLTGTTWFTSGGVDFAVGTFVDGLSVMMLVVVTLISMLVHIFSTDYVGGDRRYTHYFAFLSLFTASMLLLVISRSTVQFITAWELVGVCSFALIGHWWEEKPNSDAALKAFITNRVGDIGLLTGMIILFFVANEAVPGGGFDIPTIGTLANEGALSHTALLVASLALLLAVMSKSGQFILHTWLPDAMAGPTPVSALIHAATMVVAGVYMIARFYGVFWDGLSIGDGNLNALVVIGGITVLGGAGLAFVQSDIKKVLAYSTVSQLGYMTMALGVGAWIAAIFHLFTHAFFKAGLFLGSGSVAHSIHSFDMVKDMGGMRRFQPRTFVTFMICTAALIGLFPLAGFWSKDEILAGADQLGGGDAYRLFTVVGLLGALMTAAYMTRLVWLTFFGEPRGKAADPHHPPHESGPRILVPLYVLAGLAVVTGFLNVPDSGALSWVPEGWALRLEHYVEPVAAHFPGELPDFSHPDFDIVIALVSTVLGLLGIGLAYLYWFKGKGHGLTERSKLARAGHTALVNKYYFDHLYTGVVANGTKGPIARATYWFNQHVLDGIVDGIGRGAVRGAEFTYRVIDQGVVDGTINGSGHASSGLGQFLRRFQTGRVQQYGALLFGGAIVLAGVLVFAV